MADAQKEKAWPIADANLTNQVRCLSSAQAHSYFNKHQILDLVQQASQYNQLKKGANEGK